MNISTRHIMLTAAIAAVLGAAQTAQAHSYYNLTGAGTVASGDSAIGFGIVNSINGTDGVHLNSNGTNRMSDGTTTYNASTNNFISGTGSAAISASIPDQELGGNLPYMWYSGQHTTALGYTKREMYTGSSVTDNTGNLFNNPGLPTLPNGYVLPGTATNWGTTAAPNATANPGGLWRAYDQKNGGTNAATWGTIMADLPANGDHPYLAVAGDSWSTGQGLDYGLIHISCGTNSSTDNCAKDGNVLVTITVTNDSDYPQYNGLLDVALYRATDTSSTSSRTSSANIGAAGVQGSDLGTPIWTASMTSLSNILFHKFIFDQSEWLATDKNAGDGIHEHGFYTLLIGAHGANNSENGVAYSVLVTTSPVPVPAAAWLFGGALASLIGVNRRKRQPSV